MLARVYYSKIPVLRFAVEEIINDLRNDPFFHFKDFDIALITFSPSVYPTDERVCQTFNEYFGRNRWIAFNSLTSFANEKTLNDALVVLFIKFERRGSFEIFSARDLGRNYRKLLRETEDFLNRWNGEGLNLLFSTFSEGLIGFFIDDLSDRLYYGGNVIGGVASGPIVDNRAITHIYTSDGIIRDGFAILRLKGVQFAFGIAFGYTIMGPIYEITKAEKNKIYQINEKGVKPLIERLTKGLEEVDIRNFWYIPIVILDGKDEGLVSILRSLKSFAPDGSYMEFWGPIREGWKFRFSFAMKENLLKADVEEAIKIQKVLNTVELGFNFSCVGRQYIMEDLHTEEAKNYASIFNAPLFGFFTFGEIGPDKYRKKLKYYNQTSVVVGVREL
jgi:hypothetical protein